MEEEKIDIDQMGPDPCEKAKQPPYLGLSQQGVEKQAGIANGGRVPGLDRPWRWYKPADMGLATGERHEGGGLRTGGTRVTRERRVEVQDRGVERARMVRDGGERCGSLGELG